MHCQTSSQSMLLIKGFLLCVLLISFMEKQLNSEANPSVKREMKLYNFEVERLQNKSSCSYEVTPVKNRHARWQLKELYDIKCVNPGDSCPGVNGQIHECLQTYKNIKVEKGSKETITIYTGCVCALDYHRSNINHNS